MTEEQRARLAELLAIPAAELTDEQRAELAELQAMADAETASEESRALTDGEVEALVQKSLTKALSDAGVNADEIVAKVKELKDETVTAEKVEEIVKANAVKLDIKEVVEEVKKAIPTGVSEEKIKSLLAEALKGVRKESKMEHEISIPVAHRAGNLTVAQKQLLNICLMHSGADLENRPKNINEGITESQLAKATANGEFAVKSLRDSARYGQKLTTTAVGSGAELIDTDLSSDLQRRLYLESALATAMISSEISMPTNPFQLPMLTTRPSFFVTGETQAAIGSDAGTAAPTLNAKKLTGMVPYSYEADEDSIVAILPMLQEALGAGAADAFEGALVNGDTSATHQDSDIHGVTRHSSKLFNGLRKMTRGVAGVNMSFATGGITTANLGALRKMLKKYGMNPRDCALVVGTSAFNDISLLPEVLTQDKVAARASILQGFQPNIFGIEIIPSAACREDLNASAVYDGTTTTKSALFLVHKPSFIVGTRRQFTVEVEIDKKAQVNYVIASFRRDFIAKETPSATEPFLAMAYNF